METRKLNKYSVELIFNNDKSLSFNFLDKNAQELFLNNLHKMKIYQNIKEILYRVI